MLSNNPYQEHAIPNQRERLIQAFRKNSLGLFGFWSVLALFTITLLAPWIAPHAPDQTVGQLLMPPSWDQKGHIEFFLGTDDLGRDILSRILMGSQLTFGYALLIALGASLIGFIIGALAGMTHGLKSSVLNHILDTALSIPSLLLAIIMVAFLGPGEAQILLAVSLALIPKLIRAIYTAVHEEITKEYVIAAQLDGASHFNLLYHAILPNILTIWVTETTRAISIAILDISALGFLGLGAQAPLSEWGSMLGDSVELIYIAPWTVTLPGLAIMFSIFAINLLGDGLRQALNAGID